MKKKYIIGAVSALIVLTVAFCSYLLFKDYKSFHIGRALISSSGEFIFVGENGSPTVLSNETWSKDPFKGITDGDRVLVVYGMVLTSYPGQSGAHLCFKLSDGNIDDVNEETLKSLREHGWIDGQ